MTDPGPVLAAACRRVGIDPGGATTIRAGENTLYRLPGAVVARVSREGCVEAARREIRVSRWLRQAGIPVVEALPGVTQPVAVGGRAVTFWRELPPHQDGGVDQVADALRGIHRLQIPAGLDLPPLDPFVRLEQRIAQARVFDANDRAWLLRRLRLLRERYADLPAGLPPSAVHGDAWGGNIVTTADGGLIVLDLERFAYGPPEWDLVCVAVDHVTFGALTEREWARFCQRYGHDVTAWAGYDTLRDTRELRKVTFAAQMADQIPSLAAHAHHRLACIRGEAGPRPWRWHPVP